MKFDVLTLFPEMFKSLEESIIGKAKEKNLIDINLINIRDFSKDKHKKVDDKEFGKIEAIICSMTKKEKQNTKLLNASRRQRIAKGSGTTVQDINKFIKSFEMTQKMMKQMQSNKGGMRKLMKNIDEDTLKNMKF